MGFLRRFFAGKAGNAIRVAVAKTPLGAILRTRNVRWDVEKEIDHLADGQVHIWKASGIKAASGSHASAAAATPMAAGVREVQPVRWRRIETIEQELATATTRYHESAPLTKAEKRRYWATYVVIVLGDVCALTGAGVTLGELPIVAFSQALASGAAAATAGLVASELRKRQFKAEHRHADDDVPSFTVMGIDMDDLVLRVALAVIVAIMVAIFLLRLVQGLAAALGFALLGFASSAGSFINSYIHARPGAEIVDGLRQAFDDAQAEYVALTGHEAIVREAQSISQAHSIEAEHAARGEAARQGVLARLWAIFRRHPHIYGHGVEATGIPPTDLTPVISLARHNGAHPDASVRAMTGRR